MLDGFDRRYGGAGWELIRSGRHLAEGGLIAAAEGNLSARLTDGNIMITAAGERKGRLAPEGLLIVDPNGRVIRGHRAPSSEMALHLAAYRSRADIGAVVHAHPLGATAFAAAEIAPTWTALAESVDQLGPVPLALFREPGTSDLAIEIARHLAHASAVLLAHHGAVTVGGSLSEALARMELLERLCQVEIQARALGGVKSLPGPLSR